MKAKQNIISSTRVAYQNWREPEHMRMLAHLYWHFMLFASVIVVVVSAAYGAYSLVSIGDETGAQKIVAPPPSLDKVKLNYVISRFSQREAEFETLKSSATAVADPSRASKD